MKSDLELLLETLMSSKENTLTKDSLISIIVSAMRKKQQLEELYELEMESQLNAFEVSIGLEQS